MSIFLDKHFPFHFSSVMLFTYTSAVPGSFCFLLINSIIYIYKTPISRISPVQMSHGSNGTVIMSS